MKKPKNVPASGGAGAPELMSAEDFALSLGISRATVYRAMKSGALKAKKLGRLTRIEPAARQAFIDALPMR